MTDSTPRRGRAREGGDTPSSESRSQGGHGISLVPQPIEESEVQAQLDEIDVDSPRVGIVMGSKSDMDTMEKAAEELSARGILHEIRVMSAAPRAGAGGRILQERAHARAARDHRRRRHLCCAPGRCRSAHRPAGHRRAALGRLPPRAGSMRSCRSCRCRPGVPGRMRRAGQPAQRSDPGGRRSSAA